MQHFEEIQGKKRVKTKDFNSAKLSFKVTDKQCKTSKNSSNVTFMSSSPKNYNFSPNQELTGKASAKGFIVNINIIQCIQRLRIQLKYSKTETREVKVEE